MKEALDYGEGWCWDDENPMLNALSIGRKYNFLETFAEEVARAGINLERVQAHGGTCTTECPTDSYLSP